LGFENLPPISFFCSMRLRASRLVAAAEAAALAATLSSAAPRAKTWEQICW